MPKYLIQASYTAEGAEGLIAEGGSGRVEVVERVTHSLGGTLEALYFGYGKDDVIAIVDLPDGVAVAAAGLAVTASGALHTRATPLLTPADIDKAVRLEPAFRAPGPH